MWRHIQGELCNGTETQTSLSSAGLQGHAVEVPVAAECASRPSVNLQLRGKEFRALLRAAVTAVDTPDTDSDVNCCRGRRSRDWEKPRNMNQRNGSM